MTYKEIFEHALAGGEFLDELGAVWCLDVSRDRWHCNQGRGWVGVGEPLLRKLSKHEPERVVYLHRRSLDNGQPAWDMQPATVLHDWTLAALKLIYRGDELVDSEVVKGGKA
jgi:hypothetical protein